MCEVANVNCGGKGKAYLLDGAVLRK